MLVFALALTAVAFALLVTSLVTGNIVWAWGCIAICLIGVGALIYDVVGGRRRQETAGKELAAATDADTDSAK